MHYLFYPNSFYLYLTLTIFRLPLSLQVFLKILHLHRFICRLHFHLILELHLIPLIILPFLPYLNLHYHYTYYFPLHELLPLTLFPFFLPLLLFQKLFFPYHMQVNNHYSQHDLTNDSISYFFPTSTMSIIFLLSFRFYPTYLFRKTRFSF